MMNKILKTILYIGLLIALQATKAQSVQFKVELLADGVTYQVSLKPSVTWATPNNNTLGAQVTMLAPTGSFQITNLTSINGTWSTLPPISGPSENLTKDYFVVYLVSSTNLPYTANVETPLFTFQRDGACAGTIELIDNNIDPFMPPNSQSLNVGNYVATRGGGGSSTNLWSANYGGAADCRTCSVEYKLLPLSIGKYRVSMIPKISWSGALATTATQQITIRVPTGGFQVSNITNLVSGVVYGQTSRFDAPSENSTKDYLVFNLQTLGTRNISYVANTEVPLFTFENSGICSTGNVELMNNTIDVFRVPNSRSANVGQQLTTIGGGVDIPICLNTSYSAACGTPCPNPSSNFLGSDGAFCSGIEGNLDIVSNFTNFQWTPTTGLTCSNCASPKVTITQNTRYIVTATNPQTGCPVRDTLNLFVLPVPVITGIDTIPNISCTTANGSIIIRATITTGDSLEYSIDNGLNWQDSPVFNNLVGGTYILCARTKIDQCVITFTGNPVFFRPATPPSVSTVLKTDITDCSLTNGSIRITATGNTSTLKYSINNGQTFSDSPVFNNLLAGNYTIVVTNSTASCSTNYPQTITVLGKTPPTIQTIDVQQITDCNNPNGLIAVTARSGIAPLQYSINGGQTWKTNPIFSNLAAGNYTLQVRNADSTCVVMRLIMINACVISAATTVRGTAFKTCNPTSIQDANAQKMPNISVILRGNGNSTLRSITTDAQGFYRFDSLSQGSYTLKMSLPAGYAFVKQNGGTDRSIDSDVDSTGTIAFSISTGSGTTLNFDAGYRDSEAPVITPRHPLLANRRSGDTLTFSCVNPPIFKIGDVTAKDNIDTIVVQDSTGNGFWGRPVTRIQFIDIARKIGNCARDGYASLIECEWRATDNCSNRSSFKVIIKITDEQAPILRGVPSNITVNTEANIPIPAPVTASDNCTTGLIPVLNQTQQNTTQPCEYLLTRTWTATDDCGNNTTASQQILVRKDSSCNVRLCAPSALSQDSVVVTNACGAQPKACINLPKNIIDNYNIAINNLPYTAILEGCKFDTAISYSYFSLPNRGARVPFDLEYWIINGQSYSALNIPSMQALADTMNRIDPNGRWVLDLINYCVTRTNYYQTPNYGTIRISYGSSGSHAILQVNRSTMPYGTNLNIQRGRSVISLVNKMTGCTDSVAVYATCVTNGRIEINMVRGQIKEECLDLSQMLGSRIAIKRIATSSVDANFSTSNTSSCILIKALNNISKDSIKYVVTDEFGIHDTTILIVNIQSHSVANRVKDGIRVNTGFSPNDDGINDYFVIENIELYPLCILSVYNRWGAKVMQSTGYRNNWNGTWQNGVLPDGTYFYHLEIEKGNKLSGYLQITR